MVIIRTRAEEISIQAVSPESNFGGAAKALKDVKGRLTSARPAHLENFICRPPMLDGARNRRLGHWPLIRNRARAWRSHKHLMLLCFVGIWRPRDPTS